MFRKESQWIGYTSMGNGKIIDDKVMEKIYEKLKTPYKYGAIIKDDGYLIDSPVVFKNEGHWYMSYIRIDRECKTGYESMIAKSDDLIHFDTIGRIFEENNGWDSVQTSSYALFIDNEFGGSNEIKKINDRYYFAFIGGHKTGYETDPLIMGLGFTSDISDPDSYRKKKDPIISPMDEDARYGETLTVYKPSAFIDEKMTTGHKYVMAYNAKNDLHRESIFLAVSDDGEHWMRYSDKAVIDVFLTTNNIYGDPEIVMIDGHYVMLYFVFDGKNAYNTFAVSDDLVNWEKWEGKKLIESEYEWENVFAHKQWVFMEGGIVYHYYCAVNDKGERFIALATSKELEDKKR